jgi:serine/threonine protein kinase
MWLPGPEHIKAYMKMILEGVGFLHRNWVLHRFVRRCLRSVCAHIESSVQQIGTRPVKEAAWVATSSNMTAHAP